MLSRPKRYVGLLFIILCLCTGCGQNQPVQRSDIIMDTAVTLTASGDEAKAAIDESMARLKNLENMVSPNVPDSDVNKLAQSAGKKQKTSYKQDHKQQLSQIRCFYTDQIHHYTKQHD